MAHVPHTDTDTDTDTTGLRRPPCAAHQARTAGRGARATALAMETSRRAAAVAGMTFSTTVIATIAAVLLLIVAAPVGRCEAAAPTDAAAFLAAHCLDCHGADDPAAGLALADLAPPPDGSVDTDPEAALLARWVRIHDRVRDGEMPPPEAAAVPASQRDAFLGNLAARLVAADRRAKGTVLRRLNREEFERSLNALLGTHVQVASLLPEDGRAHGFDTVGAALDLSAVQVERLMEAAGTALDASDGFGPPPEGRVQSFSFAEGRNAASVGTAWQRLDDGGVGIVTECCTPVKVHELRIDHPGRYRVRLRTAALNASEPVVYRVHAGRDFFDSMPLVDIFEARPGPPQVETFEVVLQRGETIRLWPRLPTHWLPAEKIAGHGGPGLALYGLEVEGPLVEDWPPRGHRLRFGDLAAEDMGPKNQRDKSWYRPRYELVSDDPAADAARVLPAFLEAAFRRPVTPEDVAPYAALARAELAGGATLRQALRTAHVAALTAPDFLFLVEPEGPLDGHSLAARLALMLWSEPPDAELRAAAAAGRLTHDDELRRQTERLLDDPRSGTFVRRFLEQWLNLREIDFTTPDAQLYPEYDPTLRHAMLRETELFFTEMLRENRPVREFLDSDWTFLNGRLAEHYGIPGVRGAALRKALLEPAQHRGGILTHASVLKVSANGTTTSPVTRGAYVLERILGITPPPPPPGIPGVEPDIRGATTLREKLALHRDVETCQACHRLIDPPGFALESYDVMGGWRDHERRLGDDFPKPDPSLTGGRSVRWRVGPPVDPSGVTADGESFADLADYKRILLARPERFAGALAAKLATYGAGRGMGFSDRTELDRIATAAVAEGRGFRDLVHAVIQSPLVRSK